jgi:hypothetical protein
MFGRRVLTILGGMVTALVVLAGPAMAHHCYNPNKPTGAGVNYAVVGFEGGEPVFEQVGPGKGIGGFADFFGTEVHTMGAGSNDHAGNPEKMPERLLCDEQGIDYLGCP